MFFPAAKVILSDPSDKSKILLIKRSINGKESYEPVGGRVIVDPENKIAETFEECAIREAKEELGYTIQIDRYVGSYYFFWSISPENCSICALFLGTALHRDPRFVENEDKNELPISPVWVSVEDIVNKRIQIDHSQIGLSEALVNCFGVCAGSRNQ